MKNELKEAKKLSEEKDNELKEIKKQLKQEKSRRKSLSKELKAKNEDISNGHSSSRDLQSVCRKQH